jgi:hypothetical protein
MSGPGITPGRACTVTRHNLNVSPTTGHWSLRQFGDVLNVQATPNECGDYGIVVPTKEPETTGTAVCPSNKSAMSVNLDKGDLIERRVPLRPLGISGDELHSIVPD